MAIYSLSIPFPEFKIGDIADPTEVNANNSSIQSKVNEVVNAVNNIDIVDDDGNIVVPSYIKETYIDPVEIKSPLITGNSLIGASGIVGITSLGTTNDSIRIWAGNSNKNIAPFRVSHDGSAYMTRATIGGEFFTTTNDGSIITSKLVENANGGHLSIFDIQGRLNATLGSESGSGDNTGGTLVLFKDVPDGGDITQYRRIEFGIASAYDRGIGTLRTANDKALVGFNSLNVADSHIYIENAEDTTPKIFLRAGSASSYINTEGGFVVGGTTKNSSYKMQVTGNLNVTGDIYVNGVKMALTPA